MSYISQRWTEERVTDLKRMNADGLSAREIAVKLGAGFSRNAVCGKIDRLNLNGHVERTATPRTKHSINKRARNDGGRLANKIASGSFGKRPAPPKVAPPRPVPIEDLVVPVSRDVGLLALNDQTCKWPVNDPPKWEPFLFCGHRQFAGRYCEYHTRLAYVPVTTRQHRQDARAA